MLESVSSENRKNRSVAREKGFSERNKKTPSYNTFFANVRNVEKQKNTRIRSAFIRP